MRKCVSYPRTAYGRKTTLSLGQSDVCRFEDGRKYRIVVRKIEGKKTVGIDRAAGVWRYVRHPDGMRWEAEASTEDTVKAGSEVTLAYDGDWSTRGTKVHAGVSWSSTDQRFPGDEEEHCADQWADCGMTPTWDPQSGTFSFTVPEDLVGKYLWISSYGSARNYNPWGFWFDPVQVVE